MASLGTSQSGTAVGVGQGLWSAQERSHMGLRGVHRQSRSIKENPGVSTEEKQDGVYRGV